MKIDQINHHQNNCIIWIYQCTKVYIYFQTWIACIFIYFFFYFIFFLLYKITTCHIMQLNRRILLFFYFIFINFACCCCCWFSIYYLVRFIFSYNFCCSLVDITREEEEERFKSNYIYYILEMSLFFGLKLELINLINK